MAGQTDRYLEVGEGDGPAAGVLGAGQQQGAVALQAAYMEAVVGGGGWSVHLAGIEHGLFRGVVEQRDAFHREPPLTRRLIESVGQLQSDTRGMKLSVQTVDLLALKEPCGILTSSSVVWL